MDLSEYLPLFLAEASEHLQELNLAIVRIEETPDDADVLDGIFRIAHSFKGSSATMGFDGIAALTHRMEDVLELLRQRKGGLGRDAIDTLLACLDALSAGVEGIERDGVEDLDPTAVIARLDALVRDRPDEAAAVAEQEAMTPDVLAALAAGQRVVVVEAVLGDDAVMPAVRAFQVLTAVGDHGPILGSNPSMDDVDAFDGRVIEAWIATEHEDDAVIAAAESVSDVQHVHLRPADGAPLDPVELRDALAEAADALADAADRAADAPRAPEAGPGDARPFELDELPHPAVFPDATAPPVGGPFAARPSAASQAPGPPASSASDEAADLPTTGPVGAGAVGDGSAAGGPPSPAPSGRATGSDGPVRPAGPAKAGPGAGRAAATVRVDAERLDLLMHTMGELVVHRTQLEVLVAGADAPGLAQAMQAVTRSSQALQAMVMQVRMIAVEAVFLRFPRMVRDLSARLGKRVELRLVGQETELDRTVVDALGDPIAHLVRNALDHGLEDPATREAAGKPATGTITIAARHSGSNVVISVSDDGAGVNAAVVAARAVERGLLTADEAAAIDPAAAVELLFHPGFSTAETTSDISGRGIGMDAVRTTIRGLGGEVTMTSEPGRGTSTEIRMPLTLAIMPALVVGTDADPDGSRYAIPLDRIERIVGLDDVAVRTMAGAEVLLVPDGTLPLLHAADAFGEPCAPPAAATPGTPVRRSTNAVIVRAGDHRVALGVVRLVGQRELVTRPLPPDLHTRAAVSGAAVLSEGGIALIVDCDALAAAADQPAGAGTTTHQIGPHA
ncbi:chemotaxis protein CheA [Patulibacter minatonensis]|uniref:chemotaxis protein CheA n=1 Tax=Patulibacter minatonensis TaxID=298163 RepID=UPI00047DA001|nr:chemotaxis protein CheA [Patulibacter minatonensis]